MSTTQDFSCDYNQLTKYDVKHKLLAESEEEFTKQG